MNFRDLLNERWIDTVQVKAPFSSVDQTVEVFVNPNKKEIDGIVRQSDNGVRAVLNPDGKTYAWDGSYFHDTILDAIKKKKKDAFHLTYDNKHNPDMLVIWKQWGSTTDEVKTVRDKVKSILPPRVNKILYTTPNDRFDQGEEKIVNLKTLA